MQTVFVVFEAHGVEGDSAPTHVFVSEALMRQTFPDARNWFDVPVSYSGVVYRELEIIDNAA